MLSGCLKAWVFRGLVRLLEAGLPARTLFQKNLLSGQRRCERFWRPVLHFTIAAEGCGRMMCSHSGKVHTLKCVNQYTCRGCDPFFGLAVKVTVMPHEVKAFFASPFCRPKTACTLRRLLSALEILLSWKRIITVSCCLCGRAGASGQSEGWESLFMQRILG